MMKHRLSFKTKADNVETGIDLTFHLQHILKIENTLTLHLYITAFAHSFIQEGGSVCFTQNITLDDKSIGQEKPL